MFLLLCVSEKEGPSCILLRTYRLLMILYMVHTRVMRPCCAAVRPCCAAAWYHRTYCVSVFVRVELCSGNRENNTFRHSGTLGVAGCNKFEGNFTT